MQRFPRLAVRSLAVIAVAGLLATAIQLSPVPRDPYASALADLSVATTAVAANTCNKQCGQAPRGLKFRCYDTTNSTSCKVVNGGNDCAVGTC